MEKQPPANSVPVYRPNGKVWNDAGKRVVIHSVGGALVGVKGTVAYGPRDFTFVAMAKVKGKNGKPKLNPVNKKPTVQPHAFWTGPAWCVKLDFEGDHYLHFVQSELTFK